MSDLQSLSERELIDVYLVADSDTSQRAIDELYRRHKGLIPKALDLFGFNHELYDRNDLINEAWMRLLQVLRLFNPDKSGFPNFVFIVTRSYLQSLENKIKRPIRGGKATTVSIDDRLKSDSDYTYADTLADTKEKPIIDRIIRDEKVQRARRQIAKKLPPRALAIFDGMIAERGFDDDPVVDEYGIANISIYTTARGNVRRFIRNRLAD